MNGADQEPAKAKQPVARIKPGLGRGLGALIPAMPAAEEHESGAGMAAGSARSGAPLTVDVDLIAPNPMQPRSVFDPQLLGSLADSIREHGVLQPLVVSRQTSPSGAVSYVLIAGERRFHAARAAGLQRVPVVVREATPEDQLVLALVENIQRADLNPLEEAFALQRLAGEFALTQESLAKRIGRSRVAVANTLRLLGLPEEIKSSLASGEISEGHARALLGVADSEERLGLWRRAVADGLSVRAVEAMVRRLREPPPEQPEQPPPARRAPADALSADLEQRLREALGTGVRLERGRQGGRLVIDFYSDDQLDAILELLLTTAE